MRLSRPGMDEMGFSTFNQGGASAGDWLISPTRGEISSLPAFAILPEQSRDMPAREALLDLSLIHI